MAEAFANDPIALRQVIAYEALGNVPPFDGYKKMCKRIGDGLIEYIDYEFWYMRFARGEMDMQFDGSRDPTHRTILDLPMEILEPIFQTLKPIERLMMHKVSPRLRTCIESMDPKLKRLSFKSGKEHSEINYDFTDVIYRQGKDDGCLVKCTHRKKIVSIPNSNHFELALHDISVVFNNPKLHLESLYICVDADKMQRLQEILERGGIKIKTNRVEFHTVNSTEEAAILPCLQSGTLENIIIHMREYKNTKTDKLDEMRERIRKLNEMMECKESKMLTLHLDFDENFPIEQLLNCRGLTLRSNTWRWFVSASTVIKFLEILIQSPVLETFVFDIYDSFELKEAIRNNGNPLWKAVETQDGIFMIEGLEQVFKLGISISRIRLTRQ